jgi:hypothetical protein
MVMAIARDSSMGGRSSKKTTKVVVKQDMIDFIKNQGMAAALKRAGSISAKGGKGEAEFLEGVRRMYGASRLEAATKAAMPKAKMPDTRRKYGTPNNTSKPQMVDARGKNAVGMPGKGPLARMSERKPVFGGTAQQKAQAAARAGGNLNVNRTVASKPSATKTTAQKAAETAAAKKRRDAAAAAVKRAGGRQA